MAVTRIAADSADGTSVTVPAHQVGDLLLFAAFRDGSNSTPTKPADITQLESNTSNSAGALFGYKIADTTTETSGTWTNGTEVTVVVYRGVDQTNPIGDSAPATGSGTTITYPALTFIVGDGTSWAAGIAYHRSTNCDLAVEPTGMDLVINEQNGSDEMAAMDTNAGVASWAGGTAAVEGTSSGWVGFTAEIRAAASAPTAAVTGTVTPSTTEADIVAGGETIIITLTADTWVASGATFDAQRQNIIDGLDSAESEATGWNNEVRDNLAVTDVVRTSDTVVTVTLSAQAAYDITAQETITVTVPGTALTAGNPITATPTFIVAPVVSERIQDVIGTGIIPFAR